jgi:ABC-type xylose transport system permease subunit
VERHVRLLGIFAGLWGALATLVGVSMLLLSAGAVAELLESAGTAASLTAAAFAIIGASSLLYGAGHVWASMLIRRRTPFGRVLMLALALVDLVVLPFGTGLGIYALWALLTNDGRRLFEVHTSGAA